MSPGTEVIVAIAAIGDPTIVPTVAVIVSIARSDARFDAMHSDLRGDMGVLEGIAYEHPGRIVQLKSDKQS